MLPASLFTRVLNWKQSKRPLKSRFVNSSTSVQQEPNSSKEVQTLHPDMQMNLSHDGWRGARKRKALFKLHFYQIPQEVCGCQGWDQDSFCKLMCSLFVVFLGCLLACAQSWQSIYKTNPKNQLKIGSCPKTTRSDLKTPPSIKPRAIWVPQ